MSAKNRADLISKLYKFVKKEFEVVPLASNRTVADHMLYGCCLENSTFEAADEAFAKLQENYFDWNEVRVTTVVELADLMKGLADPRAAAVSLKKTLHGIFETFYQFDLDFLRKENLSKAVASFERFKGVSPFVVAHVAQNGLGGHSIPLDRSAMLLFYTLGIVNEAEAAKFHVPGLERTIPKAKGIEFSVLMHQLAVAFASSPYSTKTREQLLKINKDAKERFPKRGGRKKKATPKSAEPAEESASQPAAKKSAEPKTAPAKKTKAAKSTKKVTKKTAKKKPVKKAKASSGGTKKPGTKKSKSTAKTTRGSATKRLSKKKPR